MHSIRVMAKITTKYALRSLEAGKKSAQFVKTPNTNRYIKEIELPISKLFWALF